VLNIGKVMNDWYRISPYKFYVVLLSGYGKTNYTNSLKQQINKNKASRAAMQPDGMLEQIFADSHMAG
jgi:hypothetical protein